MLFAAFLRAPLTSVFMAMELSQNYSIVLPVILANTIAYLISRALEPVPVFEIFTHQDGLDLPSMEEQREESNLHMEDALHPVAVPVLQGSETLAAAAAALGQYGDMKDAAAVLVHCSDRLWYAATRAEMEAILAAAQPAAAARGGGADPEVASITAEPKAVADEEGGAAVAALDPGMTLEQRLGKERTPILFPDLPLAAALPHFRRWPLLPITNRAVRGALEGTVSLDDVLRRYQER